MVVKNNTPKKIALVSSINDSFVDAYLTMMYSLYKHNPEYMSRDTIVISAGLSQSSINVIKNNVKNVKVISPALNIIKSNTSTPKRLYESFYKLIAFDIKDYDFLVVIDCDMVILKKWNIDFSNLKTNTISACRAYLKKQGKMNFFNGGFIIIPKEIPITSSDIIKMITINNSSFAEQDVLNQLFKNFNELPKAYNVEKKMYRTFKGDCTILHFVGPQKPWNSKDNALREEYAIWKKYNYEMKKNMIM